MIDIIGSAVDFGTIAGWGIGAFRLAKRVIRKEEKKIDSNAAAKEFSRSRSQPDDGVSLEMDYQWSSLFYAEIATMSESDRIEVKYKVLVMARRNREISYREFADELDRLMTRNETE